MFVRDDRAVGWGGDHLAPIRRPGPLAGLWRGQEWVKEEVRALRPELRRTPKTLRLQEKSDGLLDLKSGVEGASQAVEKACCLEALERERLDRVGKVETSG